ncbi:uL13 family ribosomal protein, partial [Gammaproteobacteria bacterium]|nr:uL13 family ribosomal protein [Gammaproteobacteria bacterium]
KKYYHHSLYPGGLKTSSFKEKINKDPQGIILNAVKGMLPKNKLSNQILKKLKVYPGESHPHEAQNPIQINLKTNNV